MLLDTQERSGQMETLYFLALCSYIHGKVLHCTHDTDRKFFHLVSLLMSSVLGKLRCTFPRHGFHTSKYVVVDGGPSQ